MRTTSATVPLNQWVQLGVVATTTNGLAVQLVVNGNVVRTLNPQATNGFGPGQAANLTVGEITDVDLDDLRFYNRALSSSELCTTLARGELGDGCIPLSPGLELDFENGQVLDTGTWRLPLVASGQFTFQNSGLGSGVIVAANSFGYTSGFASRAAQASGHSFSLWFEPSTNSDDSELTLIDFFGSCTSGPNQCGISVSAGLQSMTVRVGNGTIQGTELSIPISFGGFQSLLVTEKKVPGSRITESLSIYLDGQRTVMPIGNVDVFSGVPDFVFLGLQSGLIDEIEFWPRDLSADLEILCENGLDGQWNPATLTCSQVN
jgi:hypothetical protein